MAKTKKPTAVITRVKFNPKYRLDDRVRVRSWDDIVNEFGLKYAERLSYDPDICGKEFTIKAIRLYDDGVAYSLEDRLEKVWEELLEPVEGFVNESHIPEPKFWHLSTVRIKLWSDMVKEYGIDRFGYINTTFAFTPSMRQYCGQEFTVDVIHYNSEVGALCYSLGKPAYLGDDFEDLAFSEDMLESPDSPTNSHEKSSEETLADSAFENSVARAAAAEKAVIIDPLYKSIILSLRNAESGIDYISRNNIEDASRVDFWIGKPEYNSEYAFSGKCCYAGGQTARLVASIVIPEDKMTNFLPGDLVSIREDGLLVKLESHYEPWFKLRKEYSSNDWIDPRGRPWDFARYYLRDLSKYESVSRFRLPVQKVR